MSFLQPEICLAPLRGLTDATYRSTYSRFFNGIDWAVTPFITTVRGPRIKPSHIKEVLPQNNRGMPVVPQILGNAADDFVTLAKTLFELGYPSVNWNLGCPFARVAKKRRGSGLLPYPERIDDFLETVVRALGEKRVSVKMRLGFYSSEEIFSLLPVMEKYPLESLIIHPRTGDQQYSGLPDHDAFAKCLENSSHRIIYNGDIVTEADFIGLQKRFPRINTWMIGRGVVMNPFLPLQLKTSRKPAGDRMKRLRDFHDALFAAYEDLLSGPSHLLNKMKSVWTYFHHSFENGEAFLKRIRKVTRKSHYQKLTEQFFNDKSELNGVNWK